MDLFFGEVLTFQLVTYINIYVKSDVIIFAGAYNFFCFTSNLHGMFIIAVSFYFKF